MEEIVVAAVDDDAVYISIPELPGTGKACETATYHDNSAASSRRTFCFCRRLYVMRHEIFPKQCFANARRHTA
ncbi:hypothetical protein [Rhizobium sp. NXC14]|uniref:hypothetical protein n=1 Tax=Rhizobium sp. NXC14 TaxID=1981173 RepID=UPI001FD95954|nr:hypothetical protein [Rhizobium sp. NXC14]